MPGTGTVLVTGASGFVGRRLVTRLVDEGLLVVDVGGVGDRDATDRCDLRDRTAVRLLIERHAPSTVLHLAAMSSVGQAEGERLLTWDVNLGGTANLAAACLDLKHPVRFVFASSAEVYGASFVEGPCDEGAPLRPQSVYASSKAAAEWLLRGLAGDRFEVVVARPFNHVGAGQDMRFVVPSLAAQIAAVERSGGSGKIEVGNLDAVRDFSHVDDLIDALATLATAPVPASFNVFNIGSDEPISVRAVLDRLLHLSSAQVSIAIDPARLRASDIPVAAGNFGAFDRAFGPRQRRPLDDALRTVLAAAAEPDRSI
jgi:nucleoside-diphosphate-sugar epimerase